MLKYTGVSNLDIYKTKNSNTSLRYDVYIQPLAVAPWWRN